MTASLRTITILVLAFSCNSICYSQTVADESEHFSPEDRPKLVVGIVVDQMKAAYISRFWNKFGDAGFKRLVNDGFLFTNHHYNYFPTYTAPGHASIYTGTTPSVNGIVSNAWFDRKSGKSVYVVADSSVRTVGASDAAGEMSPKNLLSTTVTDEIKKAVPESKVIALSIKDRAAILPGGHLADAAYWYDFDTGNFISSTWYMEELPAWVHAFNDERLAQRYSKQVWKPLLPIDQYTESDDDDTAYERAFDDEDAPVFPHDMKGSLSRIIRSPFGDELLGAFVKAAIAENDLGGDDTVDFLTISFSPPDFVGHWFGPNSVEVEDIYLRLDRQIADLLVYLDDKAGKGNYLLFLTADHGVSDIPASLVDRGLPGGVFDRHAAIGSLKAHLRRKYGRGGWVESYMNQQVYLDRDLIEQRDLSLRSIQDDVAEFLEKFEGVAATNTAYRYATEGYSEGLESVYQNGFFYGRSGDVYIRLRSGWLDSTDRTSHGSPYNYDTHVPLIFYGWHIPRGLTDRKTVTPQIAPTISSMLHIPFPSGSKDRILKFGG